MRIFTVASLGPLAAGALAGGGVLPAGAAVAPAGAAKASARTRASTGAEEGRRFTGWILTDRAAGQTLSLDYCVSRAIELLSMWSRMQGTTEPVFS